MAFADDDRALASGVILFAAILVVAGLLFIALNTPTTDVINTASNYTDDTAAQDHIDLMETIWGGVLVFAAGLAALFLIARAVLESRGP